MRSIIIPLLVISGALQAQPAADAQRLSDHIRILASDDFEGRAPGTAGETRTLDYLARQFGTIGLTPAGDRGGWTQQVPLRRFEVTGQVRSQFTVQRRTRPLTEFDDIVVFTKTPVRKIDVVRAPLVFVGFGIRAPERHWDDFKGFDLKGKVALILVNDPGFEQAPKALTYYGRWTYKLEEAARRGALGALLIHDTAAAGYGWDTVRNSFSVPQYDLVEDNPMAAQPRVRGWLRHEIAAELFASAGLDLDAEQRHAHEAGFRPIELAGVTFSTHFAVNTRITLSHNFIGKLVGSQHPDEAVLFSAHWDHLGVGPADAQGDRIFNGALDNASGVACVLELARLFASSAPTQRSVYFINFTAEEKGDLGSRFYANHPLTSLGKTVALLNIDGANLKGPTRDVSSRGGPLNSPLDDLLALEAGAAGRQFVTDPALEQGYFFRADQFSLARVGVPALGYAAGLDLEEGGVAAGNAWAADYLAHRYHQPADEWRADLDLRGAVADTMIYYSLGRRLADSRVWPAWKPGSPFKGIRDQTAIDRSNTR